MQIIDAMRSSNSANEICLLVTNYVESLQFYAAAEHLPAGIVTLPVCGLNDVEQRYGRLCRAKLSDRAHPNDDAHGGEIVSETEEVLFEAMCCLRALETTAGTLVLPPLTTKSFRHA